MLDRIRRRAAVILGTGLLAGLGFTAAAAPAGATVTAPAAGAPAVQTCASNADGGWCMNRSGGHTGSGTQVISWTQGDPNNGFGWTGLPDYCGGGHVTPSCPNWGNTAINREFDGYAIGEIYSAENPELCLGINGKLTSCGDPLTGVGGGYGTVQVFVGCANDPGGCGVSPILNSYWSGQHHGAYWVKIPILAGQAIVMGAGGAPPLAQLYTSVQAHITGPAPGWVLAA